MEWKNVAEAIFEEEDQKAAGIEMQTVWVEKMLIRAEVGTGKFLNALPMPLPRGGSGHVLEMMAWENETPRACEEALPPMPPVDLRRAASSCQATAQPCSDDYHTNLTNDSATPQLHWERETCPRWYVGVNG